MFTIEKIEKKGNEIQTAYLEGVIMPNGEFIHRGQGIFLTDDEVLFGLKN